MIQFFCKNCGQRLSVPEIYAGRKVRCPKCKATFIVPRPQTSGEALGNAHVDESKISSEASTGDLTLLDIPQETKAPSQPVEQPLVDETAYEQLRRLQGGLVKQESDQIPQRRLPWIIDIFLYPISKPGLIMLALIIVVPPLFKFLGKTFAFAALGFAPMLIMATLVIIVGHLIRVILWLYFYWYFCECIGESAAGQLRAPETIGGTPGLGEMLSRLLRILVCLLVFFGPVLIRFQYNRATDIVFWILLGYALFLFPVALLAVVMFDSLRGLHPFLLLGSIFSTFFQYCGLILLFVFGVGVLILGAAPRTRGAPVRAFILHCVCIYLALVAAHVLGRFYWRYQQKLNWEV